MDKIVKTRRILFPIMIIFLLAYMLVYYEQKPDRSNVLTKVKEMLGTTVQDNGSGKIPYTKSEDPEKQVVAGEVIVKVSESAQKILSQSNIVPQNTGVASLSQANIENGVTVMEPVFKNPQKKRGQELKKIYRLRFNNSVDVNRVVENYSQNPNIVWVEPNFKARMTITEPDDPKYQDGTQWSLSQASDHDIDAPEAWDYTTGSTDTVIAVIDSGVDLDHEDLDAKIWQNSGEFGGGKENNGIDDDGDGYIDDWRGWDWVTSYNNAPADNDPNPEPDGINNDGWYGIDDGVTHGTHVSGIAAAETNNSTGVAGVCWNCQIMALRILDDEGWGDYDEMAEAMEYAVDHGASVINLSLSGGYSKLADDAINYAFKNDVIIVAAAGNESINIGTYKRSPVCNDGNYNMVIGVASVTSADTLSGFSNYSGYYVDVSAPGTSIYSTLYTNDPAHGFTTDYNYMSGTSMAAPMVAGLAGLVKSAHPTWSGPEIRDRVVNLTNNLDVTNPSYYQKMGSGRINAEKSLNSANGFYPSGTVVKVSGDNNIWLISNGQKRKIPSTVFRPFYFDDIDEIVYISKSELLKYPQGPHARFPDGTLVGAKRSGSKYVIDNRYLRKMNTNSIFYALGYSSAYIRWSNTEYTHYPEGAWMDGSTHGTGAVVTADGGTNYYLIDTYLKNQIEAPAAFVKYYTKSNKAVNIDAGELAGYEDGTAIRYSDGILLGDNGSGDIYYIEYGKKRLFADEAELTSMRYRAENVRWRTGEAANYPDGQEMGF